MATTIRRAIPRALSRRLQPPVLFNFTDADNNTVFNITPTFNLGAGETKNLLFQAEFNNTVMGLTPGAQVRAEVLVTFGGAGGPQQWPKPRPAISM